jgi:hypothetical protein
MRRCIVLVVAIILSAPQTGTAEARGRILHWLESAAKKGAEESERERPSERIIPKAFGEAGKEFGKGAMGGREEEEEDKDKNEEGSE